MQINSLNEQYEFAKQVVKGRHILAMMVRHFRTADNSDFSYGVNHLFRLLYGDENIADFTIEWQRIIACMKQRRRLNQV